MNGKIRVGGGSAVRVGCGGVLGRLGGSLFCLVFLGAGLFGAVLIGRGIVVEIATYRWKTVDCVIEDSSVEDHGGENPYVPRVAYRYSDGGRELIGDRLKLNPQNHSSFSDAQEIAARYPAGATATCLVDPADPGHSILEHSSPLLALVILFPLVFVGAGGGGLFFLWRRRATGRDTEAAGPAPLAGRSQPTMPAMVLVLMGTVFLLVGALTFIYLFVVPMAKLASAQSWQEVRCTVVSSQVRSHSSDDGVTYSVQILFEYEFGDRAYRSDRYRFTTWSSSGRSAKQAVVDRYPPGFSTVCYVDPEYPARSVLDRDFHAIYLVGMATLFFAVPGAGILLWGLARRRAAAPGIEGAGLPTTFSIPGNSVTPITWNPGPLVLKPSAGPVAKVLIMILICLLWNGLISVFVWQLVSEWQRGNQQWFLALFLTPFVLVGLVLVVGVGHSFLAAFNPRPRLTLATGILRLGDRIQLDWRFSGNASLISRLVITLEGEERATYRRGTDTSTDTQVFSRTVLIDTELGIEIERGSCQLEIPDHTMHSFEAGNNKIVWQLKLEGDVANWPDVSEVFKIPVLPHSEEGAMA